MQLFSEKVKHTSTNSPHNILQVEQFSEIFFDVFEVEINKAKYPVEKIARYKGDPVVSVPVLVEGTEKFYPFILTKGKFEVLFNENNTLEPIEILPVYEKERVEIVDNRREILEQIKSAKREASEYAANLKKKKLHEANVEINEKQKILKETLDNARDSLVEEFISISNRIKGELVDVASTQYSELRETLDNKIRTISEDLEKSLKKDFSKASEQFDSNVKKLIREMYTAIVIPKVTTELTTIAQDIVSKVDKIEGSLNVGLETKADKTLVEGVSKEMDAIRSANVELNDAINRGVNRALSRVGNVKTSMDQLTEEVDTKISKAIEEISNFYSEKIRLLEDRTIDVTEESRKYFIGLINDSKHNLLEEIRKIKTETPVNM